MGSVAGPRGYPGAKGLTGAGNKGDAGLNGVGVSIVDNGDGSFTITGENGSVIIYNGDTPQKGIDYFDGDTGDFITFVYCQVPKGDPVPNIDDGSGTFDGVLETMPTGTGVVWTDTPEYTPEYTTYVSNNRYRHDRTTGGSGTWVLRYQQWAAPKIYNSPENPLVAQFISYAFIRSTTPPAVPIGGSYASPLPTTAGWTDGIPSGLSPVYMTKRLFTSDGNLQDATWTVPELLSKNEGNTRFKFGPTSAGPWDLVPDVADEWMIVSTLQSDGTWLDDEANPIRIKGETGAIAQSKITAYAFKRSVSPLNEVPSGGSYDAPFPVNGVVTGWSATIPNGTANLYISTRVFTNDGLPPQADVWSNSALFSGDGATLLKIEASSHVFSFDDTNTNPAPTQIDFSAFKQNISDTVVWTTDPIITIADNTGNKDTLVITAAEFGLNTSLKVTATAGSYTDSLTLVRVKDGVPGTPGSAVEEREVRFQFAPDNGGVAGTWHDRPMVASDDWMREGLFIAGVLSGSYSIGTRITGDDGTDIWTEFQFSADDINYHPTQQANDVYLQSRTVTNGTGGAWSATVYIRGDDGVDGKFFETQFAVSDKDTPPTISSLTRDPGINWGTDPDLTITGNQVIWATTAAITYLDTLDSPSWSTPVHWGAYTPRKGFDYFDGLAGVFVSTMYISAATVPALPTGGTYSASGESGVTANGWVDDPMSPGVGEYVWETRQTYTASIDANGNNTWAISTPWTSGIRYAYIPTLGTDYNDGPEGNGSFLSYVFKNFPIGNTPDPSTLAPVGGTYNGTTEDLSGITAGWTDDPITPSGNEVTWVSSRTYISVNGVWQTPPAWGDPSLFSALSTLTGYLTNEAHTAPAELNGANPDLSTASGSFKVFYGTDDVTSDCTFSIIGASTKNGLTITIDNSIGFEGNYSLSGNGWSTNAEEFTLRATHNVSNSIVLKKYTISKSNTGATGIAGVGSRLDIAYAINNTGSSVNWPPAASSAGKTWQGTRVVSWIPPAAEPPVSTNYALYEWTQLDPRTNLIDPRQWTIGTSGSQGDFSQNGATDENSIILGNGPHGASEAIWRGQSNSGDGTGPDGGWYNNISFAEGYDPAKTYRFVVWAKTTEHTGRVYLGCYQSLNMGGTVNTNPYFWSGDLPDINKWYLIVGILHGDGYSGAVSGISGVYDPSTGERVISGVDFISDNTVSLQRHRTYLYYSNTLTNVAEFARPRVDELNGNEPSLADIIGRLGSNGISNRVDFAYADNGDGSGNFSTTIQPTSEWLGTNTVSWTPPAPEPGQGIPSDYVWIQFRDIDVINPPTPVAGASVSPNVESVSISWDSANYSGHSHTQIFRGTSTNAYAISYSNFFADTDVNSSTSYNYWLQHVNENGVGGTKAGPFTTTTAPSYDEATGWIANTIANSGEAIVFNYNQFAITNPGNPDSYPFTVTNGIVYMDDVYIRGTVEAHNIINTSDGNAVLGNTVIEGELALQPNSIKWEYLDETFRDSLAFVDDNSLIYGGTRIGANTTVANGIYNIAAIGEGVDNLPITHGGDIVRVSILLTGGVTKNDNITVPLAAPTIVVETQYRPIGGSWISAATTTVTGTVDNSKDIKTSTINFRVTDEFNAPTTVGDDYEVRYILSAMSGAWGSVYAVQASVYETLVTTGEFHVDDEITYWGNNNEFGVVHRTNDISAIMYNGVQELRVELNNQNSADGFAIWAKNNVNGLVKCFDVNEVGTQYPVTTLYAAGAAKLLTKASGITVVGNLDASLDVSTNLLRTRSGTSLRLSVNSSTRLTLGTTQAAFIGDITATGNITQSASDIRLKDIQGGLFNCLGKLAEWEVFTYKWNTTARGLNPSFDHDDIEIGFSANSVQKDFPELIKFAPFDRLNGKSISGENYITMQYERTTPVIVGALQEAYVILQSLEERIIELEASTIK